ncbi:Polyhydroxyalkonate synthesis repressor, PhaR (fragment) [Methylocella tundrae]|uniref:Polyhydroxyalkonate synthesis repressor, PhaR n=1 Tax=Methylocella tundrae TaxID=227605 RepID=A0A8B6M9E0_METTU
MAKKGKNFVVSDAKSGEDITRSVLTQIIFEEERKCGQSLLSIALLRALIRFYSESIQMLVPSYLEFSINRLTSEQGKFRDNVASGGFGSQEIVSSLGSLRETAPKNMAVFMQALAVFSPFVAPLACSAEAPPKAEPAPPAKSGIEGIASKE